MVGLSVDLSAQSNPSTLRVSTFSFQSDTTINEGNSIVPQSISIVSHLDERSTDFYLSENSLKLTTESKDSITLTYRVLPINFQESRSLMDPDDIEKKSALIKIQGDYTQEELDERRYIKSNKLEYNGSFTRGVNFGNTQDLILNSNFNIQMRGDLGNGLNVLAAISDDNVPIQPEGNTQVLQEFDKLFIEISKDKTRVIGGDYELGRPKSYFMNYFKKLKGLSIMHEAKHKKNWRSENRGSFAISRGKFKRITLQTKEGNQGPYRLEGDNGEVFLQVLSGTEKVFIDGRRLQRGENHDYVIDYNRGEIRFTPNILITSFTRIIVEYEYATQSFVRSLYATTSKFQKGQWQFDINMYNEQDSKTKTSNITLDSLDLAILRESGDNAAFRPGTFIPTDGDFEQLIKYKDINGILVYAPDDSIDVVAARFSEVGPGMGAYIIDTIVAVNGRVYKYEGVGQGSYEPVVQLVAPEKKQLITASAYYGKTDDNAILFETSMSNNDKNRLAERGNGDNVGLAFHLNARTSKHLEKQKPPEDTTQQVKAPWKLTAYVNAESASMNFQALNPYRAPEFARDWNYSSVKDSLNELLYQTGLKIHNDQSSLEYNIRGFHAQDFYDGIGHVLALEHLDNNWQIIGKADLLNTKSLVQKTQFLRPNLRVSRRIVDHWRIGAYYEKEQNILRETTTDALISSSFNYDLTRLYIQSDASKNFNINASVDRRIDHRVNAQSQQLERSSESLEYGLGGAFVVPEISDLRWRTTIRDYKVTEAFIGNDDPKRTVIGLVEHKLRLLNSGLTLNSYAETNSGQEPKIEFQYVKVQKGEGTYRWEDLNEDGIAQVNEFLVEPFSDQAEYEKISIFNNEFISSVKTVLNQALRINPKKFLEDKAHFIGRFQASSRYRIDQRSVNNKSGRLIDKIVFNNPDSTFVFYSSSMDHDLFFNRGHALYDIQLSYRTLNNQITQITGYERRGSKEYYARSRINLFKSLDLLLEFSETDKTYDSEMFPLDFFIDIRKFSPQLNFRPNPKLRFVGKYKNERGNNRIGPENSTIQDLGLDVTWRSGRSNLQMKFNFVKINFSDSDNAIAKLEMLQGLEDGNNYLWTFNYTRRIGKNFDLILNYNGRKMEGSKTVNNLGAQLRAVF